MYLALNKTLSLLNSTTKKKKIEARIQIEKLKLSCRLLMANIYAIKILSLLIFMCVDFAFEIYSLKLPYICYKFSLTVSLSFKITFKNCRMSAGLYECLWLCVLQVKNVCPCCCSSL